MYSFVIGRIVDRHYLYPTRPITI